MFINIIIILGFNSGPVHLCLSISFYTQTLRSAVVRLPLRQEGGGGGSDCYSLIRKIHAMHWQSWDGTAAIVQKLWGNSARNLLLGCFNFPLCLLVQDAVSSNPFSPLLWNNASVGLSASRGQGNIYLIYLWISLKSLIPNKVRSIPAN